MIAPKDLARTSIATTNSGEARLFNADIMLKRTGAWAGGKAVLVDRQPLSARTAFKHRLKRHAVALHLEGANTHAAFQYDGGSTIKVGSTLGQVMLLPAEHQLEGWSDYPSKIRHVVVLIDPTMITDAAYEDAGISDLRLPYQRDLDDGIVARNLRALQAELNEPGVLGKLYVESLSLEIAIRIARRHSAKQPISQRGGLSPRRLSRVQDYIEANLSHEITLSDLAAVAGASNAHFCRAFHKSVGLPSHQYIIRRRVELAKRLLLEDKLPIVDVALEAGFGNQSHLTNHFRRIVGTTPWRFRQQA